MAIYRAVRLTFWTDTKITDKFTPEDKYMYLYLFTNPHTNLAGCYEIGTKHISNETGYSVEKVEKELERLSRVHKVIKYSNETNELLIINWHKYNWTTSPKFRKVLCKELEAIKCSEFREYLIDVFNDSDTVSDISEYGINTTDTDTDAVTVSDSKKEPLADVAAIPLNDGTEWIPTEKLFEEYTRLYPNVDVRREFNTMRGWCISNPQKRKTKSGITRFVNSWLSREQDKGYSNYPSQSNQQPKKEEKYSDEFFDDVIRKRREARLNADRAKMDNME